MIDLSKIEVSSRLSGYILAQEAIHGFQGLSRRPACGVC
jgi:hypothetical protein